MNATLRRACGHATVTLALALCAQAPPAQAQTMAEERRAVEQARERMERGQELYLQSRFLEAAEEFLAAYELQPFGAFLYNAAVAYERHGEHGRAADYFTRYLERDPSVADAAEVRARIGRLREAEARRAANAAGATTQTGDPAAGSSGQGTASATEAGGSGTDPSAGASGPSAGTSTGTSAQGTTSSTAGTGTATSGEVPAEMKSLLAIRTNPSGAQVTVRLGSRVVATGPSPFAHTLDEGDYRVVIEHPEYRTVEERVRIRPGKVYVVIVEMSQGQFLGALEVTSVPSDALVYVDDRSLGAVGRTRYQNIIPTGTHRIWVERPGYRTEEREIEVGLGDLVRVHVPLERVEHGRLRVVGNVRGARVFVDDRAVGTVPWEGDVAAGPRRVRVEADDMKDWEQIVRIERGQVTPVRVRLRPAVGRGGAWVTGTIAALFVAGGAIAGVMANERTDALVRLRDAGRLATNDPRLSEGQILAIGADIGFGLGAVLGILSVYYFLRDPLPDSEATVLEPRDWALVPGIGPSVAGGVLQGRF
ncbi:MAG: PEGA domain-containing protein [Myxococcota bacterium]|nr:PEGA domain-containing protein [Myxococcota bacterium]MDW8362195.1 PEGA domain-containing protein [Myxococcales bacterium]